jgi:hypothetical protein
MSSYKQAQLGKFVAHLFGHVGIERVLRQVRQGHLLA